MRQGGTDDIIDAPDLVEWATTSFYIPETNRPIEIYPRQRAALNEAVRKGADGKFVYTNVLIGDIKKSAKTTLVALRVLWQAVTVPFSQIKTIGNDHKQAQSRVYKYVERAIALQKKYDPDCPSLIKEAKSLKNTIKFPNGSEIEALPVDPAGEAGGNDDLVVFTELWGANTDRHVLMWTETVIPPMKYGKGQRWVDSYAGYYGESPILWSLYESTVEQGKRIDDRYPFYTDSSTMMFTMWNRTPDLPWQTPEYYEQQSNELTENEFIRIHRNTWVESLERFVDEVDLLKCIESDTVKRGLVFMAIDAAVENDGVGIVAIRYNLSQDRADVIYEELWLPPKDGQIDLKEVERVLYRQIRTLKPFRVAYDPYQMERIVQGFKGGRKELFAKIEQGATRNRSDALLRQRIRGAGVRFDQGGLIHQHLQNTNAKLTGGKIRMVKRSDTGKKTSVTHVTKIDVAVALSMACYVAETTKGQPLQPSTGAYGNSGQSGGTGPKPAPNQIDRNSLNGTSWNRTSSIPVEPWRTR